MKNVSILFVLLRKRVCRSGMGTKLGVSPTYQWGDWENYYISSGSENIIMSRDIKLYYSFLFGELIRLQNATWLVSPEQRWYLTRLPKVFTLDMFFFSLIRKLLHTTMWSNHCIVSFKKQNKHKISIHNELLYLYYKYYINIIYYINILIII